MTLTAVACQHHQVAVVAQFEFFGPIGMLMDLERLKKALMPERLGDDHEESNVCRQCATFPARRAIEKGIFRNRIPEMGGRLESSGCALLVRGRASRAGARHRL